METWRLNIKEKWRTLSKINFSRLSCLLRKEVDFPEFSYSWSLHPNDSIYIFIVQLSRLIPPHCAQISPLEFLFCFAVHWWGICCECGVRRWDCEGSRLNDKYHPARCLYCIISSESITSCYKKPSSLWKLINSTKAYEGIFQLRPRQMLKKMARTNSRGPFVGCSLN